MSLVLNWNPSYCIGDAEIDAEHEQLFELAKIAADATDAAKQESALMALYTYARVHFSREESLMHEMGYLGYREHTAQHNKLIAELNELSGLRGTGVSVRAKLQEFLDSWLVTHILTQDARLASHIAGRTEGAVA